MPEPVARFTPSWWVPHPAVAGSACIAHCPQGGAKGPRVSAIVATGECQHSTFDIHSIPERGADWQAREPDAGAVGAGGAPCIGVTQKRHSPSGVILSNARHPSLFPPVAIAPSPGCRDTA